MDTLHALLDVLQGARGLLIRELRHGRQKLGGFVDLVGPQLPQESRQHARRQQRARAERHGDAASDDGPARDIRTGFHVEDLHDRSWRASHRAQQHLVDGCSASA